jgi:hypothetical protein
LIQFLKIQPTVLSQLIPTACHAILYAKLVQIQLTLIRVPIAKMAGTNQLVAALGAIRTVRHVTGLILLIA